MYDQLSPISICINFPNQPFAIFLNYLLNNPISSRYICLLWN